ncbi:MAG: hypothetical protein ABI568_01530 [Pseudarthrobacter sp.]
MNNVARFIGTAALATSLTLGASALTAGAAFANSDNDRSYNDHRGNDGRRGDDRDSRHNDYKYFYRCYDRRSDDWYSFWSNRYEHKWNCHVYVVRH